jgi:hypothetical protein
MTPKKEQLLLRIKTGFAADVDAGFRKGDSEHHDDFFAMGALGLIAEAKKECVDNYTYLCGIEELLKTKN